MLSVYWPRVVVSDWQQSILHKKYSFIFCCCFLTYFNNHSYLNIFLSSIMFSIDFHQKWRGDWSSSQKRNFFFFYLLNAIWSGISSFFVFLYFNQFLSDYPPHFGSFFFKYDLQRIFLTIFCCGKCLYSQQRLFRIWSWNCYSILLLLKKNRGRCLLQVSLILS